MRAKFTVFLDKITSHFSSSFKIPWISFVSSKDYLNKVTTEYVRQLQFTGLGENLIKELNYHPIARMVGIPLSHVR